MKIAVKVSIDAMVRALRISLLDNRQRAEDAANAQRTSPKKGRDDVPTQ